MNNKKEVDQIIKFFKTSEKLKTTLRHAWTNDPKRQESTAEHTWHMALIALILASKLKSHINLSRALKMIIVHDLVEAITGDIPAFNGRHIRKSTEEEKAMRVIQSQLPKETGEEITRLWEEYQTKKTKEAIFVKMLDILDVLNQHLISDLSTWSKTEFKFNLNRKGEKYFLDEPCLYALYNQLNKELVKKVQKSL